MIVEDRYIPSTEALKFIAKAKDKYGDRYNYDKVEYLHKKKFNGSSECYKCKYIEEINI